MAETVPHRWRWITLGLTAAIVVIAAWILRGPCDRLTCKVLSEARGQWKQHGLDNYAMEINVDNGRMVVYSIRVRDGEVGSMTIHGSEAEVPRHVWPQWNVEGLFGFISEELANADDPQRAYRLNNPSHVVVRGSFDPDLGCPRHFMRYIIGRTQSIEWNVRSFK